MGGTVDPQTGEIVWDMHVPLEQQRPFYREHPPSALAELRTTALERVEWRFDGHGEPVESIFAVACPCGSTRFVVTCGVRAVDDGNEVAPPIGLECDACEAEYEIFDPGRHGYDAVRGGATYDPPEAYDELPTRHVQPPHEIIVRFEHASETLGDPEYAGREPEVFTWFTLLARDPDSQRLELLFEWECA